MKSIFVFWKSKETNCIVELLTIDACHSMKICQFIGVHFLSRTAGFP